MLHAVDRLRPIADGFGITMGQLALAWVLRQETVSSAIIGASQPAQIDENVAAADIVLDQDTLQAIDEATGAVAQR